MMIPFSKAFHTGQEEFYIKEAITNGQLAGDGVFTKKCHAWLEEKIGCKKALLTHSCTAALELAALLVNIQPGDEIIMPSFTFVSTANAFVLQGGIPVFVDIRPDTQNIDEAKIEAAITPKTKAIVPVHYAGVACEMDTIMEIAAKYGLWVIEDAAQGITSEYKSRPLGSIGHLAAFSFHSTKNISAGEGGALVINDPRFTERAEIVREKGTNRSKFFRGQVDKYTWVDIGSSYLPSDVIAAYLLAQLEAADRIQSLRHRIWESYLQGHRSMAGIYPIRLPHIPEGCKHNAHIFYIVFPDAGMRRRYMEIMRAEGVGVTFHYIPLHSSPAGKVYGRFTDELSVTNRVADCMVRLPLWAAMEKTDIDNIIAISQKTIKQICED